MPGWVTLTSSGGGTGNGSVTYSVAMNGTSLSRTAVLKIASETYTITQPAFSCDLAIVPGGKAFAAAGASDTVTVTGNPVCAWTAVSNAAWISVTGGASGAGGGTVNYTVAANSGAARTGTLTIAGVTFTVTQSGPVVAGGGLRFVPVTPCRAADTRDALLGAYGAPSMAAGAVRAFNLPQKAGCNIPATAAAYSINVTVVPKEPLGYLTIFPTGAAQPFVSTLNSLDARIKANAAIVPAGTNGEVSVYANNATDVILDVNGYFVDPAVNGAALAYYPITPCRIADTRNANGSLGGPILAAGASRNFPVLAAPCGVPSTAQAYSLNATVVPPAPLGFLTLWPTGQAQPNVSTLNAPTGAITANAAIVPAGAGGQVSAFMSSNSHLVLDINGYFAPPGAANAQRFFAVTPCRLVDTRNAAGEFGGPVLTGGATRTYRLPLAACGLPAGAQAFSLNATVVPGSAGLGFLTLWPAGATQPLVSTLNAIDGSITANAAVVPAGTAGAVASFANNQTHLILDTNGYFAP